MSEPSEAEQMQERLASIRRNLARMRADGRASLARLARTREVADSHTAKRSRDEDHGDTDVPPAA